MALAWRLGWRYVRHTGGGHILLEHVGTDDIPATHNYYTMPTTVAEGRGARNLANQARPLIRGAGVAPTGPQEPSGARRRARRTGEAHEREATREARRADLLARRSAAAMERRAGQIIEIRRLMGSG